MEQLHFVHTTDWHLGFHQYNKYERYLDFKDAALQVVDKIIELKPEFVLHTGDIFHHSRPSPGTIRQAVKVLKRLEKHDIPTYIIRGNHDGKQSRQLERGGGIISLLKDLKLVKYLNDGIFTVPNTDCEILGVGYYPSQGVVGKIDEILSFNPEFLNNDMFKILAIHAFVEGQLEDISQISLEKISELGFDYIGAGHYHIPWSKEQYRLYAPGSTEATSSNDWRRDDRVENISLYSSFNEIHITSGSTNEPRITTHQILTRPKIMIDHYSNKKNHKEISQEINSIIRKKMNKVIELEPKLAEKQPIITIKLQTNLSFEENSLIKIDKELEKQILHINFEIEGQEKSKLEDVSDIMMSQTLEKIIQDQIEQNGQNKQQFLEIVLEILQKSSTIPSSRDLSEDNFKNITAMIQSIIESRDAPNSSE